MWNKFERKMEALSRDLFGTGYDVAAMNIALSLIVIILIAQLVKE